MIREITIKIDESKINFTSDVDLTGKERGNGASGAFGEFVYLIVTEALDSLGYVLREENFEDNPVIGNSDAITHWIGCGCCSDTILMCKPEEK